MIGTAEGIVRAWAIRRKADGERWNAERLRNLCGTPSQPVPGRIGSRIPIHVNAEIDESIVPEEFMPKRIEDTPRRVYLQRRHFLRHGYSENCEGCRRSRTSGALTMRAHTEECRRRMYLAMASDEEDRRYLERSMRRFNVILTEAGVNMHS